MQASYSEGCAAYTCTNYCYMGIVFYICYGKVRRGYKARSTAMSA